jgi:hypothetical protein
MTPFEEHLKEALLRKQPSQDFVKRVLEKAQEQHPRAPVWKWWSQRAWAWQFAPVMAALILVSGAVMYHEHQRTVRGEIAKEQLLIAVRIAGSKLHSAQEHVMHIQHEGVER